MECLKMLDRDLKSNLRVKNFNMLTQEQFWQLQSSVQQIQPDLQRVLQAEWNLLEFFRKNGQDILKQYFKEILQVPKHDVVDDFNDAVIKLCITFADVSEQAGSPQLLNSLKAAASFQDVPPILDNQSSNLSLNWLAACLQEVPLTVFTDEEKRVLLQKFCSVCQQVAAAQVAEASKKQARDCYLKKDLKTNIDEFLAHELQILYSRAKSSQRRGRGSK